ncbi:MAG: hypothetical protein IBJ03_06790 [Gemmatimonadaceae bacterium]|nr:hypothetical protein [Gemmatimonadaceae bacterium]
MTMAHGIAIDAQIEETSLDCGDEGTRQLAPRSGVQLITFSTPYDCSACTPHLAALDSLKKQGMLPEGDAMVLWAPGENLDHEVGMVRGKTHRTVCVDQKGMMWDRHDLQHTPVTVLLVDGRVVYMNDRLLDSESQRAAFLQDLMQYSGTGPHRSD